MSAGPFTLASLNLRVLHIPLATTCATPAGHETKSVMLISPVFDQQDWLPTSISAESSSALAPPILLTSLHKSLSPIANRHLQKWTFHRFFSRRLFVSKHQRYPRPIAQSPFAMLRHRPAHILYQGQPALQGSQVFKPDFVVLYPLLVRGNVLPTFLTKCNLGSCLLQDRFYSIHPVSPELTFSLPPSRYSISHSRV